MHGTNATVSDKPVWTQDAWALGTADAKSGLKVQLLSRQTCTWPYSYGHLATPNSPVERIFGYSILKQDS
jgi:hypothetical protein